MSDTTTDTSAANEGEAEAEPKALPGDGLREGIVDELRRRLGESLVDTVLRPNDDLWVRVATPAWRAGRRSRAGARLRLLLLPVGARLDAVAVRPRARTIRPQPPPERTTEIVQGVTGGDTRFQVFARVTDTRRHVGFTLKVDVPDDTMTVDSWFAVYAGANWHERETHEMFGISFAGHPDLRNMYLPMEFEGYPLRKDFPLLARMVKPWPGIVDVEPMPAEEEPPQDEVAGEVVPDNPTPEQADAGIGVPPAEDVAEEAALEHSVEEAPDSSEPELDTAANPAEGDPS